MQRHDELSCSPLIDDVFSVLFSFLSTSFFFTKARMTVSKRWYQYIFKYVIKHENGDIRECEKDAIERYESYGTFSSTKMISRLIPRFEGLKTLKLPKNYGYLGDNRLADGIEAMVSLTELTIAQYHHTSMSFKKLTNLTTLGIRGLGEEGLGGKFMYDLYMTCLPNLTKLQLKRVVCDFGFTMFSGRFIKTNFPKLIALKLEGTSMSDSDLYTHFTGLRELKLRGDFYKDQKTIRNITDESIYRLTNLTSLDIRYGCSNWDYSIRVDETPYISGWSIAHLTQLTSLNLHVERIIMEDEHFLPLINLKQVDFPKRVNMLYLKK